MKYFRFCSSVMVVVLALSLGLIAGRALPDVTSAATLRESTQTVMQKPLSDPPVPTTAGDAPETEPAQAPQSLGPNALPTSPGTYYKNYAGVNFIPFDPKEVVVNYQIGSRVYVFTDTNSTTAQVHARLDLPQGAQVTEVAFFYVHNSATPILFRLSAFDTSTSTFFNIRSVDSSNVVTTVIQTAVFTGTPITTIDNTTFSYQLEFFPGFGTPLPADPSTLQLAGARIGYKVPTAYIPFATRNSSSSW